MTSMDRKTARINAPSLLPRRARESSKHDYGRLLIVGGSTGCSGAPTLASRAAVRGGAGLVHLAVPQRHIHDRRRQERRGHGHARRRNSRTAAHERRAIAALERTRRALRRAGHRPRPRPQRGAVYALCARWPEYRSADLARCRRAVGALAARAGFLAGLKRPAVLTPHEGEFTRHLGGDLTLGRVEAARRYAAKSAASWCSRARTRSWPSRTV